MLAGYETTSVTLTYCIYLLSKHPQAEMKLLQEVDQFKGQPHYEDLDQFPYAAAVLNEALRVFPPVPMFSRVAQEDVQVLVILMLTITEPWHCNILPLCSHLLCGHAHTQYSQIRLQT